MDAERARADAAALDLIGENNRLNVENQKLKREKENLYQANRLLQRQLDALYKLIETLD